MLTHFLEVAMLGEIAVATYPFKADFDYSLKTTCFLIGCNSYYDWNVFNNDRLS